MDNLKNLQNLTQEKKNIYTTLKTTALFECLSNRQLLDLVSHCRLIHKRKGSVIYRKEDSSNQLFIIQSGYIMESVFYGSSADIIVKVRCEGEYLGEMGILCNEPYPNTALALEECALIAIPKTYFLDTVWSNTGVCRVIIRELIERLLNSAHNMVNAMYLDAPGRLASTIVNLTTSTRQKSMKIRITQSSLASSSGMARQTAAKILGEWRKAGIISTERGQLRVLDFNGLLDIILDSEIGE